MENYNSHINVFCDGGIGNRINSLISGIAIANHFNIKITVYWPTNSWCAAAFEDIFSNDLNIKNEKLTEVKDKFANSNMMLHMYLHWQFGYLLLRCLHQHLLYRYQQHEQLVNYFRKLRS